MCCGTAMTGTYDWPTDRGCERTIGKLIEGIARRQGGAVIWFCMAEDGVSPRASVGSVPVLSLILHLLPFLALRFHFWVIRVLFRQISHANPFCTWVSVVIYTLAKTVMNRTPV
jgi:hypothetical protein